VHDFNVRLASHLTTSFFSMKMITEGTVDDDIYAMQKRKAEMTAAIFSHENGSSSVQMKDCGNKKTPNGQEKEDITSIMKVAIDRFLASPK
jgi:SNF2 family DNA or RNA helicase